MSQISAERRAAVQKYKNKETVKKLSKALGVAVSVDLYTSIKADVNADAIRKFNLDD